MRAFLVLSVAILSACGSIVENTPAHPDVALFFVSGHNPNGQAYSYLSLTGDAGPQLVADLEATGHSVTAFYYVDDANPLNGYGGYLQLISDLQYAKDNWAPYGTRIAIVAHSHGVVWTHAAVRIFPDLTITAQVDLDASSYGWGVVGHTAQNSVLGYDPRDAFRIVQLATCPSGPSHPSEATDLYDVEDVVFPNVQYALEVRGGELAPFGLEFYDEKWNVRSDGQLHGMSCYFAGTSHSEVHAASGITLPVVSSWLKDHLPR